MRQAPRPRVRVAAVNRRGIAALAVLAALAACALWLVRPAGATPAATRGATLSVTGVVVDNCPVSTGGSVIYVKPGDTVDFRTTLAGINLGLIQIPGVGSTLKSDQVAAFNSDLALTDERTAAGKQVVRSLTTRTDYRRTFARQGTYTFGWTAKSIQLLPIPVLLPNGITIPLSGRTDVVSAGAALSWKGQVVVSPNAGPCGLSAQLPGVSASASVTGIGKLPTVGVPGINLPTATLPSNIPTISLPGGRTSSAGRPGQKTSSQSGYHVDYTPHGPGVAATTVPTGYGADGGGQGGDGGVGPQINASPGATYGSAAPAANVVGKRHAVELARPDATGQGTGLPVLWIIAAVAALSTATVAYARQFLAGGRG